MTPQERLRIFNEERRAQGRTAEERRRIFLEEQAAQRQAPATAPTAPDPFSERAYDAFARSGGTLARGVRNLTAIGAAGGVPGANTALQKIDAFMNERDAELAARRASRPPGGLATRAAETIIEAAPLVSAGALLTPTGAGLPVAMATGAGYGAITADWRNPTQAAIQTAIGAAAPPAAKLVGAGVRAGAEGVKRLLGRGAEQLVEAEAAAIPGSTRTAVRPSAGNEVRPSEISNASPVRPTAVTPTAVPTQSALQSAFQKLGTDNVEEIGDIIANANRRYRQSSTPQQIQSSVDDFHRINQLTLDEQRALSQILPERPVSPVVPNLQGPGGYSRNVSDIPASEVDAQLDANLRSLEEFFGSQGGATAGRATAQQAAMRGPTAGAALDLPPLEIEAPSPTFGVKAAPGTPYKETAGPRLGGAPEMAAQGGGVKPPAKPPAFGVDDPWEPQWAQQPVQQEIMKGVLDVPVALRQRIANEMFGTLGAFKSLKSIGDVSSLFRQGGILLLRPMQWKQSGRFIADTFRSFKTKTANAINEAIAADPDAALYNNVGGYFANRAGGTLSKGEEAFLRRSGSKISEAIGKTPGMKHFEQSFTTGLDAQRLGAFKQYKALIDKAGLSPEQAQVGYKAAAEWINIATGRGSMGQRLDKAMDGLNFFLFSPRFVASRLNVFNPAMYIRNASTPGGRVVLKQQMSDLLQFASVVATTMGLAKAAGADVGLNPNSPDFLKIKIGNWRYDTLAGVQQVMRLIYRVGADVNRAAHGQKPKVGQTAIDIAETFLSYKLSPPASVFRNFINQRTPDKKPFTAGGAVADLAAPIQWWDFVEAYEKEGWGGVLMASPGVPGIGAQRYDQTPQDAAIEKAQPLFSELQRLNRKVSELRRRDNEADPDYNARVQMFSDNYTQYGLKLLASPRFQSAPDNIKTLALDRLNEQAKKLTLQEFAFPALTLDANELMDSAENSKRNPANQK